MPVPAAPSLSARTALELILQAPFPVAVARGQNFVLEHANTEMLRVWGKGEEIVGKPILEGLPEIAGQGFDDLLRQVLRTGEPYWGREVLCRLARGPNRDELEDVYFTFVYAPVRAAGGSSDTILVAAIEVTDQIRARRVSEANADELRRKQTALELSERRFRSLVMSTAEIVWVTDGDGRVTTPSDGWLAFTGQTPADSLGHGWFNAVHPDDCKGVTIAWAQAKVNGGRYEVDYRLRRHDGVYRHMHVRGAPVSHPGAAPTEWVGTALDITEDKELRSRLAISERMTAIGTLAAGVAHEVNNPLAAAIANVDFALESTPAGAVAPEITQALQEAQQALSRAKKIVHDLKTFSRPEEDQREQISLSGPLKAALSMAHNELRHVAEVHVNLQPDVAVVANEGRLAQVFLNLLTNASHAMASAKPPKNGDGHHLRVWCGAQQGSAVVEVSDTGSGISPENLARIFSPFFTTKPVGVGTGLGLSVCHGIVASLGGGIDVDSAPGRGTVVRVRLPLAAAAGAERADGSAAHPPEPKPQQPTPADAGNKPTVFVIDDDILVGRSLARALKHTAEVRLFDSAATALEAFNNGDLPDLVLCDLMMPLMNGMELYEQLARDNEPLTKRFVFITGGAFTERTRAFLESPSIRSINKPFDSDVVRAMARSSRSQQ